MCRAVSVVRGFVPFSGWALEVGDAHKKKKEFCLLFPIYLGSAHDRSYERFEILLPRTVRNTDS